MSYPPSLTSKDRKALEVIAKGHPDRKMTATEGGVSSQVSALTWDEIQVALGATLANISDRIAHLIANDYIGSGCQDAPSFWKRLRGEAGTAYFWITAKGRRFLQESLSEADASDSGGLKTSIADLEMVEACLKQLGYGLTQYGTGVAVLSIESGYSPAETASHLALATLALDAKEAGFDIMKLSALAPHARTMMDVLSEFKNAGLMREELFKNDARAMLKVVMLDKDQPTWIAKVLSDPVVSKDRVATSQINYRDMLG